MTGMLTKCTKLIERVRKGLTFRPRGAHVGGFVGLASMHCILFGVQHVPRNTIIILWIPRGFGSFKFFA